MGYIMNKLFDLEFGSTLYGTRTENSDTDYKSIYLPTPREIVLNTYQKSINPNRSKQVNERNTKDDIDVEIFSLDRYTKLLSESQTVAIDMLFAPSEFFKNVDLDNFHIFTEIYNNRDKFLSKEINAFISYAKTQAAKYGLKGFRVAAFRDTLDFLSEFRDHDTLSDELIYPKLCKFVYKRPQQEPEAKTDLITIDSKTSKNGVTETYLQVCRKYYPLKAPIKLIRTQIQGKFDEYGKRALMAEKNEGIDWKALSHAVRVNSQGIELLNTGRITFPRPDKDLLLQIKTGKHAYKDVEEVILEGFQKLEEAKEKSTLRDKPDLEWIDNFVYNTYAEIVYDYERTFEPKYIEGKL